MKSLLLIDTQRAYRRCVYASILPKAFSIRFKSTVEDVISYQPLWFIQIFFIIKEKKEKMSLDDMAISLYELNYCSQDREE